MAPPEFSDIGKAAKDLLGKDYNFGKTKLDVKSLTATGVEFSSLLERNDKDGTLKGEVKSKFKHADSGLTFTDTFNTSNELTVKTEATELADGLKVEVEGSFQPYSAFKELKFGFNYKADSFTTTASANLFHKPEAKTDFVFGYEGIVAGAQLSLDLASTSLKSYAAALGYSEKDYSVALHASESLTQFSTSYSHNVSSDISIAANASWGTGDKSVKLEFGTQYKIDKDATLKAKFDSDGKVGLGYSQKIRPDLKASFGLQVDTRNLEANAHKFGYSFTFEPK